MNRKVVFIGALALFQWVCLGNGHSDEQEGDFVASTNGVALSLKVPANPRDPNPTSFTLWQLPSQKNTIQMSYVLRSIGGKLVVIDGGKTHDAEYLRNFIRTQGNHVSAWFITHPHSDHVDALTWILSNPDGMVIDNIYASFPPMEWYQKYAPGTAGTLSNFFAALENANRSYTDADPGDAFDIDKIHIEILSTESPELTADAVNNSSMTMRVSDPAKTVLFLADLSLDGGNKLLGNIDHAKLKAEYVQMAHHGQGAVSEAFYQVVQPTYCLWPTPLWLWNNDRHGGGYDSGPWTTLETRQWMDDLNVKSNYVSCLSGLVEIK